MRASSEQDGVLPSLRRGHYEASPQSVKALEAQGFSRARREAEEDLDDMLMTDEMYLERHRVLNTQMRRLDPFEGNDPVPPRHTAARALSQMGELIYAVRMPDGVIKIGHTANLENRLRELGARGVQVLAFKYGSRADEQAVHASLAAHCARAIEWYHPHPEVLAVVNGWRAQLGRPPVAA